MAVFQAKREHPEFFHAGLPRPGPAGHGGHPVVAGQPRARVSRGRPRLHRYGDTEYEPIARKYRVPIVVTGFEPVDILQGVYMCVKQLEEGRCEVENQYARSVAKDGNVPAIAMVQNIFEVVSASGAGSGRSPKAGSG